MENKKFIFRFDIDTIKCINGGVDNLVKLGKKYDVKFVFFINMGKAISLKLFIKNLLNKNNHHNGNEEEICSLSAFRKLGLIDYLQTAMINPNVGMSNIKNIKKLFENGHEIGLHGGKNHAIWAENIMKMTEDEIKEDLSWSLNKLRNIIGDEKIGFASPEWEGGKKLRKVLSDMNFLYCADSHGPQTDNIYDDHLPILPTNILYEPTGVGFYEGFTYKNLNHDKLKEIIIHSINTHNYSVIYDHPYFAGVEGLALVETIKIVQELNIDIVRYCDII